MANTREISTEEKWMIEFFEELKKNNFIKKIEYQPEPIILSDKVVVNIKKELKTKTKITQKTVLNSHVYTPDFLITWNGENIFHKSIDNDYFNEVPPVFFSFMNRSFIEVKGNNRFDNNMTRLFTTRTQPWIWQKYEIFVNLTKVPDIFKTFIPEKILPDFFYKRNTKKNKIGDKKFNWEYRTLKEFIENEQSED